MNALALLLLPACLMRVEPDEVAVIYRLGAVQRTATPGLSMRLPAPLERDERISIYEVRRAGPGRLRLVTGDTNLVELDLVVQYTVADPVAFSLAVADPEAALVDVVASVSGAIVARVGVDELLTTGRAALQQEILVECQQALDGLHAGLHLEAVEVRELVPPDAVVAAFNDVSSARGDKETTVLAALAYAGQRLPQVRGEGVAAVEAAKTDAARLRARTEGHVARFERLLPAWREDPGALRARLSAETAAALRARVHVVPAGSTWTAPGALGAPAASVEEAP